MTKLIKVFLLFSVAAMFSSCAKADSNSSVKQVQDSKKAKASVEMKNPDFEKIDSVLSKMSSRFQSEVKIPDEKKNEFLADLKTLQAEQISIQEEYQSNDLSLFYLIDKTHTVSADYVPKGLIHLVSNENYSVNKNSLNLRPEAYYALEEMCRAAKSEGVKLTVSSTYRSYEYQKNLFDYWVRVDGLEEAERESARPGTSQHQLGLALDFAPVDDKFDETTGGQWVYKNAADYGWSLSFPKNYEDITGYRWECWHFRYIGKFACKFQKKWFCDVQQYMMEFLNCWNGK